MFLIVTLPVSLGMSSDWALRCQQLLRGLLHDTSPLCWRGQPPCTTVLCNTGFLSYVPISIISQHQTCDYHRKMPLADPFQKSIILNFF